MPGDQGERQPTAIAAVPIGSWRSRRGQFVAGLACLAVGGLFHFMAGSTSRLTCKRTPSGAAECRLKWHTVYGVVPVRDVLIEDLRAVERTVRRPTRPWTRRSRPGVLNYQIILTGAHSALLMNLAGDDEATDAANVRIREFLQEPAATLDVTLPPPAGSLFSLFRGAGTLCLALGLLLFVGLARDRSERAGAERRFGDQQVW